MDLGTRHIEELAGKGLLQEIEGHRKRSTLGIS